jgi:cell wall-associated NlpC family hydrolase
MLDFIAQAQGVPFKDQGRSFAGWDCWGLIVAAYKQVYDITLPDLSSDYISAMDVKLVELVYEENIKVWTEVSIGRLGDLVMFRNGRFVSHCGLVVKPGYMLHALVDMETMITSYTNGRWRPKLAGIFRHEQLACLD